MTDTTVARELAAAGKHLLLAANRLAGLEPEPEPPDETPGWVDTFRHTFAGTELDLAVWHYEGELMNVKPHGTQQLDGPNLPKNVHVSDGLEIVAVREAYHSDESDMDYEWTAGGIQSNDELLHIGERIIFRHRAQVVPGMSPGWWTSSGHDDGEFDVPEMFGLMPDLWPEPSSGYRYNAFKDYNPVTQKQWNVFPADELEHESIAYWKPDNSLDFYLDGALVHSIPSSWGLPQTPQRVRVTLQVGGNAAYRGAIPADVDGFSCWTSLIAVQRPE